MTSEKKELKDYLLEEIEKSGFPLEIEVSSVLENQNWVAINNQPFRDPDEDELRSVDILAFHEPTASEYARYGPLGFSPRLVIECKKSISHAWIFFTRPERTKVFPMSGQVYDFPKAFSTEAHKNKNKLSPIGVFSYEYYFNSFADSSKGMRHIHYADFDNVAITYDEYRIQSDAKKRKEIFEAVNQVVKFQNFDMEESIRAPGRIKSATSPFFPVELSFLAIVFDGRLFEAIIKNGKPMIEERKHVLLHYRYRPRNSFVNLDFWIDIVKKGFFPTYLTKIHRDISLISDKIVAERELLLTYLKKDQRLT